MYYCVYNDNSGRSFCEGDQSNDLFGNPLVLNSWRKPIPVAAASEKNLRCELIVWLKATHRLSSTDIATYLPELKDDRHVFPLRSDAEQLIFITQNDVVFSSPMTKTPRFFWNFPIITKDGADKFRARFKSDLPVSDTFLNFLESFFGKHDEAFLSTLSKLPQFPSLFSKSELKNANRDDGWVIERQVYLELTKYFSRGTVVAILAFWKKKHGVRRDKTENLNFIPPLNINVVLRDFDLAAILQVKEPMLFAALQCLVLDPEAIDVFASFAISKQF